MIKICNDCTSRGLALPRVAVEVALGFVEVSVSVAGDICIERAAHSGALCLIVKVGLDEIGHVLEKLVTQTVPRSLKARY